MDDKEAEARPIMGTIFLVRMHKDILSATILECLNKTLSESYSVLQLHLCPWCSKDLPVLGLVWLRETILDPVGPRSGKHPQEVNYLAGKEAPSSVLINYLWRYNYSG